MPSAATPATASLFIVNPFGAIGSGLARLLSTHPPAGARIRRLRELARTVHASAFEAREAPRSRLVR